MKPKVRVEQNLAERYYEVIPVEKVDNIRAGIIDKIRASYLDAKEVHDVLDQTYVTPVVAITEIEDDPLTEQLPGVEKCRRAGRDLLNQLAELSLVATVLNDEITPVKVNTHFTELISDEKVLKQMAAALGCEIGNFTLDILESLELAYLTGNVAHLEKIIKERGFHSFDDLTAFIGAAIISGDDEREEEVPEVGSYGPLNKVGLDNNKNPYIHISPDLVTKPSNLARDLTLVGGPLLVGALNIHTSPIAGLTLTAIGSIFALIIARQNRLKHENTNHIFQDVLSASILQTIAMNPDNGKVGIDRYKVDNTYISVGEKL